MPTTPDVLTNSLYHFVSTLVRPPATTFMFGFARRTAGPAALTRFAKDETRVLDGSGAQKSGRFGSFHSWIASMRSVEFTVEPL